MVVTNRALYLSYLPGNKSLLSIRMNFSAPKNFGKTDKTDLIRTFFFISKSIRW
jgi:hypothetical protein